MVAASLVVTKAGPGTIAEAAAVGLPVLLTSYLPGQEAGNVDVVLEEGFGDFSKDPKTIAELTSAWLRDDDLMISMSKCAEKCARPDAAKDIATTIYEDAEANRVEMESKGLRRYV